MPPAPHQAKASAARGGGRGRRRRSGIAEEEDGERWLVTYADLLTVLFALFVVLFAISALNESKFQQLKYSLAAVFGDGSIGVLDGSPALNAANDNSVAQPPTAPEMPKTDNPYIPALPDTGGLPSDDGQAKTKTGTNKQISSITTGNTDLDKKIQAELDNFDKVRVDIDKRLDQADLHGAASYAIDQRGLIVTVVTDALVFPGNSATLLPKGQKLLAAIAPAIKKVPNNVEVDGFTNQVDVSTYPYPSGWELSSARASSVVRYLQSHGLNDRQLEAVGFSDQKPLIDPKDPRSVTRNRRVEIVVLSTLPSLAGDTLKAAAAAGVPVGAPPPTAASSTNANDAAAGAAATTAAGSARATAAPGAGTDTGQAARAGGSATRAPATRAPATGAPATGAATPDATVPAQPHQTDPQR